MREAKHCILLARVRFKRKRLKQRYARQINMPEHVPFAQTIPFERDMFWRVRFKRKRLKQRYARQINMPEHVPFAQTIPFERDMF
ncbi:hypothetical protein [Mesorhizobium xinjiangense]|uniref:hypothetical protein n=1 Tax=Mesorhizobium xinjiangense TaxID=2678685 RepID=UPI0012EE80FB|nr:hypothetical protein [Mesorhizobium xinjiangense]